MSQGEVVRSVAATQRYAAALAEKLTPGSVIALVGELGAGKTSFVQGLAQGMGVHDMGQVLSPTYTLVNEYPGARGTLVHVDLYRLADAEAARSLGIEEQLHRRDAVVAVEWANHFPELVPGHAVWIELVAVSARHREIRVGRRS